MKALSIQQPWAWLIVNGYKDIENRDWSTRLRDSERRRDTVGLPLWIFDHVGERFLVAVKPDGSASIDGGHADAQGVAKARELFQRLAVIRPPHGTKYVMLTVDTVPTFVGSLNEEAIAINNDAARAAQPEETNHER